MSRSARLALHARSDFDLDTRRTRLLCGPLLSQPVEVELMELVVDKDRRRDRYSSRLDRATGREDDRRSGLKNFKRFRKVRKTEMCVCVCYTTCTYTCICYSYALSLYACIYFHVRKIAGSSFVISNVYPNKTEFHFG